MATTFTVFIFLRRKEGMALADFYQHWEEVHGALVKPWAEKHGFLHYKQVRIGGTPVPGGETVLTQYDGCAVFEAASRAVVDAALADEYVAAQMAPDQALFVQEQLTLYAAGATLAFV